MMLLVAILGIVVGWLLEIAGDTLYRYSHKQASGTASLLHSPALLRALLRRAGGETGVFEVGFELFSGVVFALLYALHGASEQTLWLVVVYSFFALITIMDYKYRIVLNILTYPGLVVALVLNIVLLRQPVLNIVLGMIFAFGVFYLTAMIRPGGLGGGDVKLATLIGAAFGFPQVLGVLIVSAAASAIAIIVLLVVRHHTPKDSIPYAPFLCLGAVVILVYSSMLIVS